MFESGHARLLAAFTVAMGLHGLLFVWQSPQLESPAFPPMQVEFLAQPRVPSTADAKQFNVHEQASSRIQKNISSPQHVIAKETIHKPVIYQQPFESLEPVITPKIVALNTEASAKPKNVVILKDDTSPQEQSDMQSGEDTDMVMPVDIQKKILMRVSYPMRARRLGWEGRAEFQINVRGQDVQQVTMLLSTGYALLDHAVQKGISSIDSLPLGDGNYSFPVVFRLR